MPCGLPFRSLSVAVPPALCRISVSYNSVGCPPIIVLCSPCLSLYGLPDSSPAVGGHTLLLPPQAPGRCPWPRGWRTLPLPVRHAIHPPLPVGLCGPGTPGRHRQSIWQGRPSCIDTLLLQMDSSRISLLSVPVDLNTSQQVGVHQCRVLQESLSVSFVDHQTERTSV